MRPRPERRGFAATDKGPPANAVRTRNFGQLVTAAGGDEALGVALSVPVARVKDLHQGYGFSDETAFHLESELDLPSGWLDHPQAQVPPGLFQAERTAGVAEPVSQTATRRTEPEIAAKEPSVSLSTPPAQAAPTRRAPSHKKMTLLQAPGLVVAARGEPSGAAAPAARAPAGSARAAPAPATAPPRPAQPPTTSSAKPAAARTKESANMMQLRRANAMLLTDFPGGKTGLGRLLGKSPANISHVLHGKRKFTREVGQEFETALQLATGWFDTPQSEQDVPARIKALLLDAFSRGAAPASQPARPKAAATATAAAGAVPGTQHTAPPPLQDSPAQAAVAEMLQASATVAVPRKVIPQPAVSPQLAIEMQRLGDQQARPLAQALVRVILLLSRNNELSESKCLRLLNEVTLMAQPQLVG